MRSMNAVIISTAVIGSVFGSNFFEMDIQRDQIKLLSGIFAAQNAILAEE